HGVAREAEVGVAAGRGALQRIARRAGGGGGRLAGAHHRHGRPDAQEARVARRRAVARRAGGAAGDARGGVRVAELPARAEVVAARRALRRLVAAGAALRVLVADAVARHALPVERAAGAVGEQAGVDAHRGRIADEEVGAVLRRVRGGARLFAIGRISRRGRGQRVDAAELLAREARGHVAVVARDARAVRTALPLVAARRRQIGARLVDAGAAGAAARNHDRDESRA